ncbi:DUF3329 domain-containing protein [Viscerimonas tarda]
MEKMDAKVAGRNKVQLVLILLALVFFGAAVFVLNVKTPFQWDDFRLTQIWPNEDGLKVKSFHDILTSQYNHYYTWGGRTLVHIVAQYLVYIPPLKADILNTLVYLIYATLIYFHIKGKTKHDLLLFAGVNFLIYFMQPVFGETILWLTGSANYLWGTSLILLFMLPYRMYDGQRPPKYTLPKCAGMLLLGMMSGWTNENTAAAMILMLVLFVVCYKIRKWKIPAWSVVGIVGAMAGYLIMITAPGNFMRADLRTGGMTMDLFYLSYRFLTSTELLFQYLGVLNLLGFILLLLFRQHSKSDKNYSYTNLLILLYFIGTIASVYVMLFSPFFPPRAWFGSVTFNIIAFGIIFKNLNYSLAFLRKIRMASFFFGLILFAFTYYEAIRDVIYIDNLWKERTGQIKRQQATGEKSTFHYTNSRTKFAISDPPFLGKCFRWYYGLEVDVE